jgi:fructosamine-3-kinase
MRSGPLAAEVNDLRGPLLQLLRQILGSRVELRSCQIGNSHHDYLVLLAQLRCPSIQVVIKLAGPEAPLACPFDRTAMLHSLVRARTALTMPEILAVDVSCRTWPWRYLVKTHVPGQEWAEVRQRMNAQELCDAYQQIGEAVAQLHAMRFPAFGELSVDGNVQGRGAPYLTALRGRAGRFIESERLRDLFLALLDERAPLFSGVRQASLCHEDLHRHNILFQRQKGRWRLATVLDFDKAWAGHRETDLARLELWKGMTGESFWQAYEALCPIEPLYTQRRPVYQLLWCLEYARPTAEHLADTQRLCVELGLPRIECFE